MRNVAKANRKFNRVVLNEINASSFSGAKGKSNTKRPWPHAIDSVRFPPLYIAATLNLERT